jgi:hypothetical protein
MADATIDIKANIEPTKESLNALGSSVASSVLDGLKRNKTALESKTADLIYSGKKPRTQRSNIITLSALNKAINSTEKNDLKSSFDKKKIEAAASSTITKAEISVESAKKKLEAQDVLKETKARKDKIRLSIDEAKLERQLIAQKKDELNLNKKLNENKKAGSGNIFSGLGGALNSGLTAHSVGRDGTTSIDESGLSSFAMRLGTIGAAVAVGTLAVKFFKNYAGGNIIGANAAAMGTGFNASSFAGLQNSQIVNQNVSENIGSALINNRELYSKQNRFRRLQFNDLAFNNLVTYGDESVQALRDIDESLSPSEVQNRIFSVLKKAGENASLNIGKQLGYSDETILALRSGKDVSGELAKQATKQPIYNDKEALKNAFGVTGGIEGFFGKGSIELTKFLTSLSDVNVALPNFTQRLSTEWNKNPTGVSVQTPWALNSVPGNSSAGNT